MAVRHGFEGAVDNLCQFGFIWNGGPLPEIGDDLYLPFYEEQKAQIGAPGNEVPFGDPWEVRVPTTLIKLRQDGRVPVFSSSRLFGIGKENQKDLDQGELPQELRNAFESHGVALSADDLIKISTEIPDRQWQIFDSGINAGFIVKKGETLNIYRAQVDSIDPNETEKDNG